MGATYTITPKANNLLVKMLEGSPFDLDKDYKVALISPSTNVSQMVFGEVVAVGDSPVIPDDFGEEDIFIEVGDLVIFPPTSGFKIPPPRAGATIEYRVIQAAVVAAKIEKT